MDGFIGNLLFNIMAENKTDAPTKAAIANLDKMTKEEREAYEEQKRIHAARKEVYKATAVAITAIGGAGVALIESQKGFNAALGVTALQLGITQAEMRNLALETTNVTFPLDEVQKTFDLLVRSGVSTTEELQNAANAFDLIADATGYEASQITEMMIPAMKAYGLEVEDAGNYADMMVHFFRTTTMSMEDFSTVVEKITPDLSSMGLGMEETLAILESLSDKGITGAVATKELKTAISSTMKAIAENEKLAADTTDDLNVALMTSAEKHEMFLSSLGLTSEGVDQYQRRLTSATGVANDFANMATTQFTVLDNLKQKWSEVSLQVGSALTPYESVFGMMAALGPVMMGLGPIMSTYSAIQTGQVIPTLTAHAAAAWAAIAPYLLIIAPIIAVVAILYILEKKFGVVTKAIEIATSGFKIIAEFIKGVLEKALEGLRKAVDFLAEHITLFLGPIGLVIEVFRNWDKITGIVQGVFNKVLNLLTNFKDKMKDAGKNIIQGLIDGITSLINKPYDLIFLALKKIRNLLPYSPAKEGPLSKPVSWKSYLVDPLDNLESSLNSSLTKGITVAANVAPGSSGVGSSTTNYTIGPNYLSKDYPIDELMKDIESYEQKKQIQRGVRPV